MAESNINVGLGIGLSGKLDATNRIFAAEQAEEQYKRKLNITAQKEKDDQVEQVKRAILTEKGKFDPLVSPKANEDIANTLLAITNAKAQNPTSYINDAYRLFGDLRSRLDDYNTTSAQLADLRSLNEKQKKGVYISKSQQAAYDEIGKAKNYDEWIASLSRKGIGDDFFSIDPSTGKMITNYVVADDPTKFAQNIFNQRKNEVLDVVETKNIERAGKKIDEVRTITGIPRTREEAQKITEEKIKRTRSSVGVQPVYSGEDIAENYLSDPARRLQYTDRFPETKGMDDIQLTNHFLDNFYEPYKPYKESSRYFNPASKQEINISVGSGVGSRAFTYIKEKTILPDLAEGKGIQVEGSAYSNIGISAKSAGSYLNNKVINAKTGKSLTVGEKDGLTKTINSNKNKNVTFGSIYTIKVATKSDGTKRYLKPEDKPVSGETVKYEPVVEASFSDLDFEPTIEKITTKTIFWPLSDAKRIIGNQVMNKETRSSWDALLKEVELHSNALNKSIGKVE